MEDEIDIFQSSLVPKQEKITEEQKRELLDKFKIGLKHLPKIKEEDPVSKRLNAKRGDVIKVTRLLDSGTYNYYRVVV